MTARRRTPGWLALALLGATTLTASAAAPAQPVAAAAAPGTVSFIAFGDAGTGSTGQRALRDRMVANAGSYTFALLTGDGAYPAGSYADYTSKFFGIYGSLFQGQAQPLPPPTTGTPKPIYPSLGNHEYDTAGAAGYHDSFVLPTNGPPGVPAEKFYTFDQDGVHFVSFDSHYVVGWNQSTPQAQKDAIRAWLVADLDAHRDQVTVLYDHHPAYTAGEHHGESEETAMRSTWFPVFASRGVDLLLSGHDHGYQRNTPQSGLTSYVTAGGGGELYDITPQPFTAASLSAYHYLDVQVTGCTITTSATLADGSAYDPWTFTAPTCGTTTPPPSATFSDGFESGDLSKWTTVQTGTGGTATVQSSVVRTGTYAARLAATSTSGSFAYARTTLASTLPDVVAAGDFRIDAEGAAGGNVPLLRLYNESGTRILSLYRQNQAGNKVYVQHSGSYNTTTGTLPLGTWVRAEVRAVVDGATSTVEVRLNGILVHSTTTANLPGSGVGRVQIGNDTSGQAFSLAADDIAVGPGSSTPPPPPPPPDETLLTDGFEDGLGAWTQRTGGDGTATTQGSVVRRGARAARLSATTAGGSFAYLRRSLGGPRTVLTATADVRVEVEGLASANVPLIRLLDSAGNRVANVYRQNASSDRVYVAHSGRADLTTGRLPLATWATVSVRVVVDGAASSVRVTLDGTTVYQSATANLGSTGVTHLQLGNDTRKQKFTLYADGVDVRTS